MMPSKRQEKILELLSINNVVTISELAETFNISIETIRRDLNILEKQGKIEKVYGGAKAKDSCSGETAFEKRMVSKQSQKESIGKKCSEFVKDGDTIFIDSGSTTYHIARYLKNNKNVTIITNSIAVVNEVIDTDCDIIIIGGKIRQNERSIVTYDHLFNFSELNIQKSFICASGITVENGISDYSMQEIVTRKKIIERSQEVFVAADSSKFGRNVTMNISTLDNIDYIITDSYLNKKIASEFKKTDTKIILAED